MFEDIPMWYMLPENPNNFNEASLHNQFPEALGVFSAYLYSYTEKAL